MLAEKSVKVGLGCGPFAVRNNPGNGRCAPNKAPTTKRGARKWATGVKGTKWRADHGG